MVICTVEKIWSLGTKKKIDLPRNGKKEMSDILQDFARWQKNTGIYGYCCGKLFSKELCKDVWFDESISLAEDFDFLLKIYSKVDEINFISQTAYYYLQEADNSSVMANDYEIDYRKQLDINIRYRNFLMAETMYTGENYKIVSQQMCNYLYYTLFYCQLNEIEKCFKDLRAIYVRENIKLHGQNGMEKLLLMLFKLDCMHLTKFALIIYRMLRRIVRGRC